jgi:Carboxypeptidase regulatory-like domain
MRRPTTALSIFALTAGMLHAAVIRGNVVENQTGHPLDRAVVTIEGVGAGTQSLRTNPYGVFEFPGLPAGKYVISAARLAFAPVQYGQKHWHSSGMPISVAEGDTASLTIRMPRYGAITGTVLDENGVGLQDHEVAVYTNTRPPRLLAARARTDDRGMYRLSGLPPGSYLVRSKAKIYDDGGYLPTFYRDVPTIDLASSVEVTLDQQVDQVDFRAAPGQLVTIAGRLPRPQSGQIVIELSSDTGTEVATIDARGNFSFPPMAPGQYELLAQSSSDRARGPMAGFEELTVDRDLSDIRMSLSPLPTVQFSVEDAQGQPIDPQQFQVMVRRKNIGGDSPAETLQVAASGKAPLLPGRWDVAIEPTTAYCVVGFSWSGPDTANNGRAEGWHEILLAPATQNAVKFVLSSAPSTVSGTVKNANGDVVAGVPVFLEPYDLDPRKPLAEIRASRTNEHGQYSFAGLAPGLYRLLGTFEYQTPASSEMETAGAKSVKVEEASRAVLDLTEFVIH